MDLNPTPEQKMLRDAAQKYFRAEYGFDARAKSLAADGGAAAGAAHWARFAEFGWLGLALPESVGGFGGMPELIAVCEAMGAALSVEPYVASTVLAAQAVAAAGDAAQQQALLAPLVAGRSRLALACTEADSGPALAWVETRARRQGSGWVLDGRKTGVAGLPAADAVIVSARIDGRPGERDGIALFAVPAKAAGVEIVPYTRYDGVRSGELRLNAAQLDAAALLGEPARAFDALERAVDLATIAACADALGAMTAVLHKTGAYLATRKQFGVPLAGFQVLQHRMVDMFAALEASRSMVVMAALHADAPAAERARAASAAKVAVGERARYVGQQGVQLHGGVGMTEELDIGHYFRRLTLFEKADGGIDHHLQRFARLRRAEDGPSP
jgi:alkylation response protein AidB-like acyl-CoA dehydrogenase